MKSFVARYQDRILGALSGLDRMVFRGTLRQLSHAAGLDSFLGHRRILRKDFMAHSEALTNQIRDTTNQIAASSGRPLRYVHSSATSKEKLVRNILAEQPVAQGLICILSCVEPCMSYQVTRNPERKHIELTRTMRKCLHYYHYFIDPVFGFMHVRLQTWYPFMVQVYLNGREWLCRQLDAEQLKYERRENTLASVQNFERAQQLLTEHLKVHWPQQLERVLKLAHPLHHQLFPEPNLRYYWSVLEMEWATDLAFNSPRSLVEIYPALTQHAISHFGAADVMRFLGKRLVGNFQGEVVSDYRYRPEGLRVKHRVNSNSIKIYDKQGSVLRVETTINQPRDFKVFRRPEGKPHAAKHWLTLRKGVADIERLAQITQSSNERYYEALACVAERTALHKLVDRVCQPTRFNGRRVRALNPWSLPDAEILRAINRGEFTLNGFRNADIAGQLFAHLPESALERRRVTANVSRRLRILRAHRIIKKIPKSHRYQLTKSGRRIVTALLAARQANIDDLLKAAA
jgi:hypothetical protein